MKEIIINGFGKFRELTAEAKALEAWLKTFADADREHRLKLLTMKLAILNSWLTLLNADERFVVQKHLIDGLEWDRVAVVFASRWGKKHARSERTLQRHQTNVFEKIEAFSATHMDIILTLFDDTQQGGDIVCPTT